MKTSSLFWSPVGLLKGRGRLGCCPKRLTIKAILGDCLVIGECSRQSIHLDTIENNLAATLSTVQPSSLVTNPTVSIGEGSVPHNVPFEEEVMELLDRDFEAPRRVQIWTIEDVSGAS